MLKTLLISLLPLFVFFGNGSDLLLAGLTQNGRDGNTGTLEKMIVASGTVTMNLDPQRLGGNRVKAKLPNKSTLQFDAVRDSFFTLLVFDNELRSVLPSSMDLIPQNAAALPGKSGASSQLVLEYQAFGAPYELVVRDAKSGFVFFNIEGHSMNYNPTEHSLSISNGRMLLSNEYAAELGRPGDAGTTVGELSVAAAMRTIEITQYVNGEAKSDEMPGISSPSAGTVPGPDVIVGDLNGLAQFGTAGTQVGLAVGTDSCNLGVENLHWFQLPDNDHPVIPQNMYRMSGGATNDERFEQIGQSNVKHAFTALTQNICGLGCNGVGGPNLGSGCSDPYVSSLNAGPSLGSRAWINPYTGFYPRGDSPTPPNTHSGHNHTGTSHRIVVEMNDLNTTMNPGASYFAEAMYITPHEYTWCQSHPGQCNMNNNVSYRKYTVSGTTSFSFSPAASTVRSRPAITAWPGALFSDIVPAPGVDGIGMVAYKVTNPSAGVWHYEYAVYNQNIDRAIQSFSVPVGGAALTNVGFHAPPQQPGWSADGTLNNTGFSNAPWAQAQAGGAMTWSSETLAQNPNANAIRWGTLYNFRFDSSQPPQVTQATVGFFKTGAPITVQVLAPSIPNASVSGRVLSSDGQAVRNAVVTISQSGGGTRMVSTGSFGYYSFDNLSGGGTYTISVAAKRYTFTPQTMQINGDLTNVNFVAAP
jgi:hypothetical protein